MNSTALFFVNVFPFIQIELLHVKIVFFEQTLQQPNFHSPLVHGKTRVESFARPAFSFPPDEFPSILAFFFNAQNVALNETVIKTSPLTATWYWNDGCISPTTRPVVKLHFKQYFNILFLFLLQKEVPSTAWKLISLSLYRDRIGSQHLYN